MLRAKLNLFRGFKKVGLFSNMQALTFTTPTSPFAHSVSRFFSLMVIKVLGAFTSKLILFRRRAAKFFFKRAKFLFTFLLLRSLTAKALVSFNTIEMLFSAIRKPAIFYISAVGKLFSECLTARGFFVSFWHPSFSSAYCVSITKKSYLRLSDLGFNCILNNTETYDLIFHKPV